MKAKVSTAYPRKPEPLITYCRGINTAMTNNPYFKEISAEFLAVLGLLPAKIDDMQVATDAAKRHDTAMIAYRDTARDALIAHMLDISRFVELVAKGDLTILKSTGFNLVETKVKAIQYVLLAAFLVLKRSSVSGTMIARGKPLPGAWRHEVWITDGDPTKEENWQFYCDSPHCSHIEITGRTPGKNYSVRMRGIWAAGPGPWSPTVTLMSL